MGFAFIVVEEDARAAVQLGDDDPLGTIDDKGTVVGHERNFAHVDFLFLDVLDGAGSCFTVVQNQTNFNAQRRGVGHPRIWHSLRQIPAHPGDSSHTAAQHYRNNW